MKKTILIALVVCAVSISSASLQFTVDSTPVSFGSRVLPGILGLYKNATITDFDVTIVGNGVTFDTSGFKTVAAFDFSPVILAETTTSVRMGVSVCFGGNRPVSGLLVDGIAFSGQGTIDLINELSQGELIGSISVPEPMTMALLGFGGLFVRRRK